MNIPTYDIPSLFTTERLVIRMPKVGDAKAVYDSITASLEALKPWLAFANTEQSLEAVEKNMIEAVKKFLAKEDLRFLVFLKSGEFIASTGLHQIDWDIPKFEIGYWQDSRYLGNGYMTEAIEGLTNFATQTLQARRIEIRCDATNTRSRKLAERLSFTLEGILQNDALATDGKSLRDTCVYAKVF